MKHNAICMLCIDWITH